MTFDAHPSALLQRQPVPLLSTPQDRAALMRRLYGIDEVLIAHFDRAMLTEPWDTFLSQRLTGQLQAGMSSAGTLPRRYRGLGDPEKLRAWCSAHGIGCDVIDQVRWNGQDICSTRIRAYWQPGSWNRPTACWALTASPARSSPGSIWGTHWASPRRILPSGRHLLPALRRLCGKSLGRGRRLTPP